LALVGWDVRYVGRTSATTEALAVRLMIEVLYHRSDEADDAGEDDVAMKALGRRPEIRFFATLWTASPVLAAAWWSMLVIRSLLPTVVSLGLGWLLSAITRDVSLAGPLALVGSSLMVSLVLHPIHQVVSSNLGSRTATHLYDRLMTICSQPDGIAHLERADLAGDFSMARDFDQGVMGPPLDVSMDFIAGGLLDLGVGTTAALLLFGFNWWAPLVVGLGWASTHWLLRESGVWRDRNTDQVRAAQRQADYSYRLAVDAAPAKELRYFGLAGWVIDRFVTARSTLYDLQYRATRLREKSVLGCLAIVIVTNVAVLWALADAAADGRLSLARALVFVQAVMGASTIAFGGLNWALDGAAAPVAALERLQRAIGDTPDLRRAERPGSLPERAPELRFEGVHFSYPNTEREVLSGIDLVVPAGTSLAIVGQNGAGKTTLAKLVCHMYDPTTGVITAGGAALEGVDSSQWRQRLAAVFQDYVRFERSLRDNVAPAGAPDHVIRAALVDAGADDLAGGDLDTILSKAYPGGTDLSGGQWQRVALARTLCKVRQGADVVLLDEPTAQLDVRGEAEIFGRLLAATSHCTTILISHRFSTVRMADRIAVVEYGRVIEYGTHDELISLGRRYRTMFDLQASRFVELDESGQEVSYETL
jgi:ABC-type multidrug transport system fused ATPase/permease subunit